MKYKRLIIFSLIILAFLTLVSIKILNSGSEKRLNSAPVVVLGNVQRGIIIRSESFTGDILPIQQTSIYSKVNGNLENNFIDIGDYVRQGQVLAVIDSTIYAQNTKQAAANYYQAKVNYDNNKLTYERNLKLFEQDLIAKQDLDNSKTAMDASMAQQQAAFANYTNTLTQLGYCKITAPFSGYVTQRNFDPGAYISGSGSTQGSSLFTLMNVSRLKSMVNIPEKDVPLLDQIVDIEVSADALPGKIFKAKLKRISGAVDLSTRTMQVEIDIENPSEMLKPGMFATIIFILDKKENAMILPNNVVLNDDRGDFVYTVNPNNIVKKKYVKIGIKQDNNDEIVSGINDNDKIVFVGQSLIKDQMKVRTSK